MKKEKGKKRLFGIVFISLLFSSIFGINGIAGNIAERENETEKENKTEKLNYVMGRPMTKEEIEAQKAWEPEYLPEFAEEEGVPRVISKVGEETEDKLKIIPTAYDSRDLGYMTSVKNQGKWGTCWAFSAAACAEASLVSQGLESVEEADLSEQHLAYFVYHLPEDPLGNAAGDSIVLKPSVDYMKIGGSYLKTVFTLANWIGFADEETAPYNGQEYPQDLDAGLSYQDTAHIKNAYFLSAADTLEIKSMIMEHGAAYTSIYFDYSFYNYDTASYCYNKADATNHAVTVVGWDDNYSAQNFKEECRPLSDGAWLIRNSWGEKWGQEGYFWLSYEDAVICRDSSTFYFLQMDIIDDTLTNNYHYDGSTGNNRFRSSSDMKIAAIYQAKASETGAEALKAIGIAVVGTDVEYEIQVYKNIVDNTNPESGTPAFETPQTGTFPYSGYYTINLEEDVYLTKGDTFSVVVKLIKGDNEKVGCYVDTSYESNNYDFICSQEAGQTMIKTGQGKWNDTALKEKPWTVRAKAFTADIEPVEISSLSMQPSQITLNWEEKKKLSVSVFPSNATDTFLTWTSSNPEVATVDYLGIVKAVSTGTCKITATSRNGQEASCFVTVNKRTTASIGTSILKGENLCKEASIYRCSGFINNLEQAAYLIDGDLKTKWCSTAKNLTDTMYFDDGVQHYIVIDLGESKNFNTYTIVHAGISEAEVYNTNSWEVLVSQDSGNWVSVDYQKGNTKSITSCRLSDIQARYVMLKIWNADNQKIGTVRLYEFMLFSAGFKDVLESSWQYAPAKYVYNKGIMTGNGIDEEGNVIFAPDGKLTREQFAQVLYSAEGKPDIAYQEEFSDVQDGKWYTKAVLWAKEKGIVSGYGNGRFGVGDSITREQLASMLYKYAIEKGYETAKRSNFSKFTDAKEISDWAVKQLQWAVFYGIINGKGQKLDPKGSATRAECAAMLSVFFRTFQLEF